MREVPLHRGYSKLRTRTALFSRVTLYGKLEVTDRHCPRVLQLGLFLEQRTNIHARAAALLIFEKPLCIQTTALFSPPALPPDTLARRL